MTCGTELSPSRVLAGMLGGLEYLERLTESGQPLTRSEGEDLKHLQTRLSVLVWQVRQIQAAGWQRKR
jgi:hypothetical protein